jgi:Kef-type K+ transport system membrane component KefB
MMKRSMRVIISLIVTAVIAALGFYVTVPAINVYSEEFWILLATTAAIFCLIYWFLGRRERGQQQSASFKNLKSVFKLARRCI